MTYQELKALIASLTYKPGSKFTIQNEFEGPVLRIELSVWNSHNPDDTTMLMSQLAFKQVDLDQGPELILGRIYDKLLSMEEHEIREFYRKDGTAVVDPHPESAFALRPHPDKLVDWHRQYDLIRRTSEPKRDRPPAPRPRFKPNELLGFGFSDEDLIKKQLSLFGMDPFFGMDLSEKHVESSAKWFMQQGSTLRWKSAAADAVLSGLVAQVEQNLKRLGFPDSSIADMIIRDKPRKVAAPKFENAKGFSNKAYERFRPKTRRH